MLEIRFHGRGGQGAVTASKVLAAAALKEGKFVSAFPFFGVERRGAPVTAYTRISESPIWNKSRIYTPDYVVVLDESLLKMIKRDVSQREEGMVIQSSVAITSGLKEGGIVIINTSKEPDEIDLEHPAQVVTVDATAIAIKHNLGTKFEPIVNMPILGALVRATGIVSLDSLIEAIMEKAPYYPERNAAAAKEAYENTKIGKKKETMAVTIEVPKPAHLTEEEIEKLPIMPMGKVPATVNKTGEWKIFKPVIDYERCIRCFICWKSCPDLTISIEPDDHPKYKEKPVINYDYCKGCGICANECPVKCIEMVVEEK